MPIRIYIAPRIGNGQPVYPVSNYTDATGPFRTRVFRYLDISAGDEHTCIDHPLYGVFMSLVEASAATHTAIDSDGLITPVTPIRSATMADLRDLINTPISSFSLAWRNAAKAKLESIGVNTEWINTTHTLKNILGHFIRVSASHQLIEVNKLTNVRNFVMTNLDTPMSNISAEIKTSVADWLNSRGISTSWITPTTTVREVINTIPTVLDKLYGRSVNVMYAGEAI